MRRSLRAAWLLLPLAACCACASALRDAPSVTELTGSARYGPEAVDGLLSEAEQAYAMWKAESMERAYSLWQAAAAADPQRVEGWIGAVRSVVWLIENEADAGRREQRSRAAVGHGQLCREADPDEPACAYWLAIALGVQARERRATALDALPRIVELLATVASREPGLDDAGPDRVLALVLVRAPGWPTGPGDPELALEHARRAVELAPDHAPNRFCLAEVLQAVGQRDEARAALRAATDRARAGQAAGDPRAADWRAEIDRLQARFGQ